jgi:uncharacterized cofD-like protein
MGRLLRAQGRVLPMCSVPIDLEASVVGLDPRDPDGISSVAGQVAVATTPGRVAGVHLVPDRPPACPEAVTAVRAADWVVLGPGSWFTSVIPHLLVPELALALTETAARRAVVLNLAPQPGETDGFSPQAHLEVLRQHAAGLRIDVVIADPRTIVDVDRLAQVAGSLGAQLLIREVRTDDGTPRHDPTRLADAFAETFAATARPTNAPADRPALRAPHGRI